MEMLSPGQLRVAGPGSKQEKRKPMKCVVHIGLHKTGSSSIQNFFNENRDALLDNGVNYLSFEREDFARHANHSIPLFSLYSANPVNYRENIRQGIDTQEKARNHNYRVREIFEWEMSANTSPVFVISAEDLIWLPWPALMKFRDDLAERFEKVVIMGYVRPPSSLVNSSLSQLVADSGMTLEDVVGLTKTRPGSFMTYGRLEKFYDVFGDDAVKIRRYGADDLMDGDAVRDFLSFLGLQPQLAKKKIVDNSSLCAKAVEIFSILNRRVPLFENGAVNPKRSALQPFFRLLLQELTGRRARLRPEIVEAAIEKLADDFNRLRERTGIDLLNEQESCLQGRYLPDKGPGRKTIAFAERLAALVAADAAPDKDEQKALLGLVGSLNGGRRLTAGGRRALAGMVVCKERENLR